MNARLLPENANVPIQGKKAAVPARLGIYLTNNVYKNALPSRSNKTILAKTAQPGLSYFQVSASRHVLQSYFFKSINVFQTVLKASIPILPIKLVLNVTSPVPPVLIKPDSTALNAPLDM